MKTWQLAFLYLLILLLISCSSVKTIEAPSPTQFEIYLLMGQSNMSGRGILNDSLKQIEDQRVWMLTKDFNWEPAHHPLHYDKPSAGVGPGLSFGISMANAHEGIQIGLVPCAVGGTSIEEWEPGAYDSLTSTYPFDDAVKRINEAKKKGTIKGILWLQGESDSNPQRVDSYLNHLNKFVKRIRKLSGNRKLPVVIGELGHFNSQYAPLNEELRKAPGKIKELETASSEGLTDIGDKTHFDAHSANIYGKRFAEKMLDIQNSNSQSTICKIYPN